MAPFSQPLSAKGQGRAGLRDTMIRFLQLFKGFLASSRRRFPAVLSLHRAYRSVHGGFLYDIVSISDKFMVSCFEFVVEFVEHDVGKKRTKRAALRNTLRGFIKSSTPYRANPAADILGVQLYPSHYRADSGLAPARTCARRAHKKIPNHGDSG